MRKRMNNTITSPANGKIAAILNINKDSRIIEKGFGKIKTRFSIEEGKVVSIFMPLYVSHENVAPIGGKITNVAYEKGKFLPAFTLEKGLLNEKNEITIYNRDLGEVKVIQIAGLIARRIRCYVKKGQAVRQNQRIGKILIGSQVTLILPEKVKINVKLKQKVKAGKTIIGEYL